MIHIAATVEVDMDIHKGVGLMVRVAALILGELFHCSSSAPEWPWRAVGER